METLEHELRRHALKSANATRLFGSRRRQPRVLSTVPLGLCNWLAHNASLADRYTDAQGHKVFVSW